MNAETIISLVVGILVACLGFFLVRFINRHDQFETSTRLSLSNIKTKLKEQSSDITYQLKILESKIQENGVDSKMKSNINKLTGELSDIKKDIEREIRPSIEKSDENYGRIIVLEKKLLTMFQSVELLVKRSSKPRQE